MAKVALVTGASKGIGAATAVAFAKAGYDVVVNYLNDTASAEAVKKEIIAAGQKAYLVQANAFSEDGIKKLFAETKKIVGKIDVLVNNAGDPNEPAWEEYTCDDVNRSLGANFGATVLCSQEAVKLMDEGSILFTSSIYGLPFGGNPSLLLYSAGKAAMINFAQTLAEKLRPKIRCNVVAPGMTKTPAWDTVDEDYTKAGLSMTLQDEWVESEEIAAAFVFLAETPHMNAQTITVDSGWMKKIRANSVRH
jgi:3-oxoacyl-[acyl-carrier protein] reductase